MAARPVCACIIVLVLVSSGFSGGKNQKPDDKKGAPLNKNLEDAYPNFIIRPGNPDAAIFEVFSLTKKANAGDAIAQQDLGLCYLEGYGTVPDTVKAAYWIGRAARNGHAVANFNRAVFAMNAWGVPWNPFEAYDGLHFAAEAGMKEAQYYMSRLLIENLVVARNIPLAYHYIKLASDSGYAPAKEILDEFVKNGWDKVVAPPKEHSSKGEKSAKHASDKQQSSAIESWSPSSRLSGPWS